MPCSDSTSSLVIKLDKDEKFIKFEFAKITCSSEIKGNTGFSQYCTTKTLPEIINLSFIQTAADLKLNTEEEQYVLYLEWDALRSAIAQYLGIEDPQIDSSRCLITSIEYTDEGIEIAEVILPPKEMPKILPCSLNER